MSDKNRARRSARKALQRLGRIGMLRSGPWAPLPPRPEKNLERWLPPGHGRSHCGGHPHPLNLRIEGTRHTIWEDGRLSGSNKRRCDAPARGTPRGPMRYADYPEVDEISRQASLQRNDLAQFKTCNQNACFRQSGNRVLGRKGHA